MRKLEFLGASGGVTGSSYLLTGEKGNLLIDLGMFQGLDEKDDANMSRLPIEIASLQGVLLTHAHLDHCGRLPLLTKVGYKGKIYTTEATRAIAKISLFDAAALQDESKGPVLYTKEDVEHTISAMEIVEYDTPFSVGEFRITFKNAGHILGSASILVSDEKKTIVFSGDLGNTPEDLISPTESIAKAKIVVMESTYGNTTHPKEDASQILRKEVEAIEKNGGVLLIPAFSIERTQEILHVIGHLIEQHKINSSIPIFLDSPMAIEVTEVFKKFPQLYNKELAEDTHPFDFPSLVMTRKVEESKDILKAYSPKIIIAGSGMVSGGRILHHLYNYVSHPTTRILLVGYQAVGTVGRDLEEKTPTITVYGEELPVKATVTKMEAFSSHADQPKLLSWLKKIKGVEEVFLVHGEDPQREALSSAIKNELQIQKVVLPMKGDTYEIN